MPERDLLIANRQTQVVHPREQPLFVSPPDQPRLILSGEIGNNERVGRINMFGIDSARRTMIPIRGEPSRGASVI